MATHSSILAWRISKDRGSLAGGSPQRMKMYERKKREMKLWEKV